MHRYRRGHGFESRSSLKVFSRLWFHCWSCVHNCDDQLCLLSYILGTHEGTSPAILSFHKSRGQVPSCELAIFSSKSSRSYQSLVPATIRTNWNQFEFLGQAPETCSPKCFVWTVRVTSPCDQSLRLNYLGGLETSHKSWRTYPNTQLVAFNSLIILTSSVA